MSIAKPTVERLETRDCPAAPRPFAVTQSESPSLRGFKVVADPGAISADEVRELRCGLVRDLAPLAPAGRLGAVLSVRVHASNPDDDSPASGWLDARSGVAHVFADVHREIAEPGERLSDLMRITVEQSVAFAGGAGWFWDHDDPGNVLNGDPHAGDGGRIDPTAGLVGEGRDAAFAYLHRGV